MTKKKKTYIFLNFLIQLINIFAELRKNIKKKCKA